MSFFSAVLFSVVRAGTSDRGAAKKSRLHEAQTRC